jgi:murein DD-endopeptidase MepM/ murein hydrolase activator NlpD
MNPQVLLNKPKTEQDLTPKITKISNFSNLVKSSNEITKTSNKLKKVFEKGTYQKKTQSVILNRYKRRLDSIQKQNDKRFSQKKTVKIKPPDIKKYTGSLFTGGGVGDPLKMMAGLAALNAFTKLKDGKWVDAIGPGLVASGLLFGPSLLKGGINLSRMGKAQPQAATPTVSPGKGTPYAETKAGKAYSEMQAQRNLPKWAQRAAGGSASRFSASNARVFQGTANIGDKARVASRRFGFSGAGGIAEKLATKGGSTSAKAGGTVAAKAAGVGARAIPLLGAALNIGLSAYRFSEGDVVGGILSAVSAIPIIGWAALGVDLAREFGAFDGTALGRKGKDKLKQQTKEQKKLVEKSPEGGILSFRKTLNSYERVVNKFEKLSTSFKLTAEGQFDEPPMPAPTRVTPGSGYTGPISGDTFFPLPGGDVGTHGNVSSGQAFGGYREGRSEGHQGLDMTHHQGALDAPVSAYKTGKVVAAISNGYNGFVEIDHGGGLRTLYYHTTPMVSVGEEVYGGQQIAKLYPAGGSTHLHFGISNNGTYENPLPHVKSVKNKLPSALTRERAKQQHDSSSQTARPASASFAIAPSQQPAAQPRPTPAAGQQSLFSMGSDIITDSVIDPSPRQIASPPVIQRPILETYPSYDSRSQAGQIVPLPIPIPQQQPQIIQQESSSSMIMGPSEEQMLNSFYKKVLLNTLR